MKEVEPHLRRLVYEKNHWDEAIIKFRETERKNWNIANTKLIDHLRSTGFHPEDRQLPYVHVLDLAEDGHIKPHIDSTRVSCITQPHAEIFVKKFPIFLVLWINSYCFEFIVRLRIEVGPF